MTRCLPAKRLFISVSNERARPPHPSGLRVNVPKSVGPRVLHNMRHHMHSTAVPGYKHRPGVSRGHGENVISRPADGAVAHSRALLAPSLGPFLFFSFFFFFFLETNEKNSLQGGTLGPFASVEGQYLIAVQNFSTLRLGQSIRALPPATAKGTGNNSCGTVVFTNASANIARTLIKSGRALGMELSKAL
jgi:hypothetical protein